MNFFDRLGEKASKTYQVTKEKASNLSEELKIKSKINELNEKIEKIYTDIGIIVYKQINSGNDVSREEVVAKCEEISRKKDEISKLEEQILALKNVKVCLKCGAAINLTDEYCSKCGEKQPKQENVEIKKEPENVKTTEVIEVSTVNTEETSNNTEENTVANENSENNNSNKDNINNNN